MDNPGAMAGGGVDDLMIGECGKEIDHQIYCGLVAKHRGECVEQSTVYHDQRLEYRALIRELADMLERVHGDACAHAREHGAISAAGDLLVRPDVVAARGRK